MVHIGDHLLWDHLRFKFGDHFRSGDHLRRCTEVFLHFSCNLFLWPGIITRAITPGFKFGFPFESKAVNPMSSSVSVNPRKEHSYLKCLFGQQGFL